LLNAQKYEGKDQLLITTEVIVVKFPLHMQNLKDDLQLGRSGK